MAKKKKKVKPTKEDGLVHFMTSPQNALLRGSCYLLISFFAAVGVMSYTVMFIAHGTEPESNWLGTFGNWLGKVLVSGSFGVASLGLAFLLFIYGLRLLSKNRSNKPERAPRRTLWHDDLLWRKTLWSSLFWVMWLCTTIGMLSNPAKGDQNTIGSAMAGVVGTEMARMLYNTLKIGFPILQIFLAILYLVLVHHVRIPLPERKERPVDKKANQDIFHDDEPKQKTNIVDTTEEDEDEDEDEEEENVGFLQRIFGKKKRVPVDGGQQDIFHDDNSDPFFKAAFATVPSDPVEEDGDEDGEDDHGAEFESDSHIDNIVIDRVQKRMDKKNVVEPKFTVEGEETLNPEGDDTDTFTIDDQFERVNRIAGRPGEKVEATDLNSGVSDGPIFTVQEMPNQDSAHDIEDIDDGDDYRAHYGIGDPYDPKLDLKEFKMPDVDILEDWEKKNVKVTSEELVKNKDRIVETLRDYGIEITEISAQPGPTVTLYKIKPARGVRISKIQSLENDIALSLAALGIRIIAPIPGESNIGIEVPNAKPQIVAMKTMLESEKFRNAQMELPIAFGKTISNECFVTDLAKMPHLLMAGATGTGKSVGLNAVLASLLYTKHPSELKLVLVDPKKVEFSLYSRIERHYLAVMPDELSKDPDKREPVITDVKKVVRTLNSLCIEMDTRYDLLKAAKVRKITEYNEKFCKRMLNPDNGHRYLPYIVVVIDEFGDLIMTAGKEVELPICRLAQLARAVGIHLIIATQRPTTNIITGTIKANFPARVAFRVTSGIDSKTILDTGGAQQLIGRGDMLISLAGKDLVRLQCALIDTPEIEKLVTFIGEQRGYAEGEGFVLPEYLDENDAPNKEFDAKAKDEFFNDAARLVVASQFGSTSLLQRKLQLGYNRAGRIIDQLEAAGIVGPYNGSKARDVLIKDEVSLEELLRSL